MKQDDSLPSYDRPPVIEVVLAVQFESLPQFGVVHFGSLWQRYRARFPNVEQKPPLAPVIEQLGVPSAPNQVHFEVVSPDGLTPRVWFVSESGDELIQIQKDRFIRNWRWVPVAGSEYPRYAESIRPKFEEDYRLFCDFLKKEIGVEVEASQCEVTYINHIRPCSAWAAHKDISRVFRGWNPNYVDLVEEEVETIAVRVNHILYDEGKEFLGRLFVQIQSGFKSPPQAPGKDEPIFVLTMTARGRPTGAGSSGVLGFLDTGRRTIVNTFDRITTPEMHKIWGKR